MRQTSQKCFRCLTPYTHSPSSGALCGTRDRYPCEMQDNNAEQVWEQARDWAVIRPFVYYQRENLVSRNMVEGRDVVDFSAGLGDLSSYVHSLGSSSLLATVPETHAPRPSELPESVEWRTDVGASNISEMLQADSADVVLARMVIQFPTVESHAIDVDGILSQMRTVLRSGGTMLVTTHAYFSLPAFAGDRSGDHDHLAAVEADVQQLLGSDDEFTRSVATETVGLIELVRYLDLPPREGPFGRTGFGLKIPMLVNSFVKAGFTVESVDEIEPFTFPTGLPESVSHLNESITELGARVMAIKQKHLATPGAADPYLRPVILGKMIREIRALLPVTAVPIVRIVATRDG